MFPELLANLFPLSAGKVVANITCSDPSMAEMVISQLPSSRFLSHFRGYPQGRPTITCSEPEFAKMIGKGMMIRCRLRGTDSAIFDKSDRLPSAVIILQSVWFHPMFHSLAPSSQIMHIADLPSMSMGSSCPCMLLRTVGAALTYQNSMCPAWSFRPENAEMWVILIVFGATRVLAVAYLSLGTDIVLAFGRSWKVKSPVSLAWRARIG